MAISERKFKEQPNEISLAVAVVLFTQVTLKRRDQQRRTAEHCCRARGNVCLPAPGFMEKAKSGALALWLL